MLPYERFTSHVITLQNAMTAFARTSIDYLNFMQALKNDLIGSANPPTHIDYLYGEPYERPVIWVPIKDRVTLSQFAVNAVVVDPPFHFVVYTRPDLGTPATKRTFTFYERFAFYLEDLALNQAKGRARGKWKPTNGDGSNAMRIRVPHR